jgi:two-component system CheB/CheR fusion protein
MPKTPKQKSSSRSKNGKVAARDKMQGNGRDGAEKKRAFPEPVAVVGLGASAGGVGALQEFFETMPADSGLAFVVVMHLSPDFESSLAEVLGQTTAMPVVQVSGEVKVEPNHVYVIPPNKHLMMADSTLCLQERQQAPGQRVAIDLFFRTLADAYGQRAVCAVLTGTDADGVIGLKHIKAQGGVTMAQEPSEAEHETMPRAAIETGMVDWVMPVREMPKKLIEFVHNEKRMELPPEQSPDGEEKETDHRPAAAIRARQTSDAKDEDALQEVLQHLRTQTGHDFGHYKRATVLRRIARRLQVNSLEDIPSYLTFVRSHRGEARALLQDLLISVTHFFRDRDAFVALEANIPQLFGGKQASDQVRVWVPACATGEEAYSIAMLLCEQAEKLENPPAVQIFATDIDEEAIGDARDGLYLSTIEADVSQERLRRFFSRDRGRYRVKKEVRETVLFAPHDVLKDPPFSRLDLISCRNLLIYLKRGTQARVLDIFHFSLRPGGLLFVGGSESVEEAGTLFSPVEKHHRIYVRRAAPRPAWTIPTLPLSPVPRTLRHSTITRSPVMPALTPPAITESEEEAQVEFQGQERRALLFGQLHLQLLEKYAPPSVIINQNNSIVHLSAKAGRYLRFGGGEPSANLFELVQPVLRLELRTAIFRARQEKTKISVNNVSVPIDGETELLDVHVQPVEETDAAEDFALIIFEKRRGGVPNELGTAPPPEPLARHLEEELVHVKQQLNSTVEQYEASNEELKASNEELQAMNEEVRSTAEELETSKEELQSINEELSTVNHELKSNIEALSHANSDLQNLMSSTDIGTIFLDRQLHINRFTPPVQEVFNLLPSDIGRPLSDITHKLKYSRLSADAEQVLNDLSTIEREVRDGGDVWFLARLKPYRTTEDKIDGVVITFVDISGRKRMETKLRENAERMRRAFEVETIGVLFFNNNGAVTEANEAFLKMSGYSREDVQSGLVRWDMMTPAEWMTRSLEAFAELKKTGRTTPYEKQYVRKDGTRWWGLFTAARLDEDENVKYVLDITDRKEAERALAESEERFRQFAENSADVLWVINSEPLQLEYVSPAFETVWGEPRDKIMNDQHRWEELLHPEDRERAVEGFTHLLQGKPFAHNYRIIQPGTGRVCWIRDTGFPIRNERGEITRVAGISQDVTAERNQMEALTESEERFRLLVDGARDYAIFLLDPENRIIHWSAGAERVFGWSADEALGQSGNLVFTPEDRARKQEQKELNTAMREGYANDCRWHLRKDGSRVWVDGVMRRLDDEEGNLRGFAKVARDATEQREAQEALKRTQNELEERVRQRTAQLWTANAELQDEISRRERLEQEILDIGEREKRRIGQDLHDTLCQELTAAAFMLQTTAKRLKEKRAAESKEVGEAAKIVNANVGLARDLARGLHPVEISASGLSTALRELAFLTSTEIACRFEAPRAVRISDQNVALGLYRIAQEAVKNAVKHAKAGAIVISLQRNRQGIELTIADNGDGLRAKKNVKGMGLHLMEYRARNLSGNLRVEPNSPKGTRIICTVPGRK